MLSLIRSPRLVFYGVKGGQRENRPPGGERHIQFEVQHSLICYCALTEEYFRQGELFLDGG
jgi:hypothetical protein